MPLEPSGSRELDLMFGHIRSPVEGLHGPSNKAQPPYASFSRDSSISLEDQPLSDDERHDRERRLSRIPSGDGDAPHSNGAASDQKDIHASQPESPSQSAVDEFLLPAPAPGSLMKVWIKDPEKVETVKLGIKSNYITYSVVTESALPGYSQDKAQVRRRFSDFDTLHHMLRHNYRGYFIPPLPEKSFVDSKLAREGFVRLRRVDLQAYMRAVAGHPVLRSCEEVRLFLTTPGELSCTAAWTALQARPKLVDTMKGMFGGVLGGDSGGGAVKGGPTPSVMSRVRQGLAWTRKEGMSEDELKLRQAKENLRELQAQLGAACGVARTLVQHMEQLCEDYADMGRSFSVMARFEEHLGAKSGQYTDAGQCAATRTADLQKMGYCNLRQHSLWKQFTMKTAASLVYMHDYLLLVPEAIAALEEREAALANVEAAEADLAARRAALTRGEEAVAKAPSSAAKRVASLQSAVASAEEVVKAARAHYNLLAERNSSELARLNLDRTADFHAMLRSFANVQVQLCAAAGEVWASAAQNLKNTVGPLH